MAIDYNALLSNEQKAEILNGRIRQFAAEAYQISLNKQTALELDSADQVEKIDESLLMLEKAIEIHQKELTLLV